MKPIAILVAVSLTGCASTQEYSQYVAAQSEANRLHVDTQKPLVRITAQPGMAITGLAGLEVYMPGAAPVIQQARPNEWVGVVSQAIGVIGAVGGIYAGGKAAEGLLNSASKFIQPNANVSTVTTNTGAVTNTGPVTTTNTGPVTKTGPVTTTTTNTPTTTTTTNTPTTTTTTTPTTTTTTGPVTTTTTGDTTTGATTTTTSGDTSTVGANSGTNSGNSTPTTTTTTSTNTDTSTTTTNPVAAAPAAVP